MVTKRGMTRIQYTFCSLYELLRKKYLQYYRFEKSRDDSEMCSEYMYESTNQTV